MNTLKFLGVGTSLEAGREVVGRYRVRVTGLLPRFDPDAEAAASGEHAAEPTPWWRRVVAWFRLPAASWPSMPETSPIAPSGIEEVSGRSQPVEQSAKPNAVPAEPVLPGDFSPAEPNETKAPRNPIQREFRFENVTVVCNDLHDADFEIVPVPRSRRTPVEAAEPRAVARA